MRILVTGTSGQIGSVIASMLSSEHSVVGIDLEPGKYTTHEGDIAIRDFIFSVTPGIDSVIHTSSLHAPHLKEYPAESFVKTNIDGTRHLLEASIKNKVNRFVYTSTTSLYGHAMNPDKEAVWVTEDLIPQPRDIYDETKIAAEELCRSFSEKHGLPCTSLRVSRFFPEPEYLTAIYRLYRGVDVRDAAEAHILAMKVDSKGYDVFNISARSPFSANETHELLHDAPRVLLRHFPSLDRQFTKRSWKLPKSIDRVYVIHKAEKHLGYRPRCNFDDYLRELNIIS
ncbi:MAG: NAD(P)-dependent oxidoreductase [Candidatus Aminicenantes bacterium]|nr:MAG: NAD(P)-dependent oxidoreductase [Candidatus Aminicenantes bacterium]